MSDKKTCGCPDDNILTEEGKCQPSCEINNGNCQQICKGSSKDLSCSCFEGYMMYNSTHCQDVNECTLEHSSPCEYECLNIVGSFKCNCPEGLILNDDKLTCRKLQKPCETPLSPEHGILTCEGNESHLNCTVSCNNEYALQGMAYSECQNGEWNQNISKCVRKYFVFFISFVQHIY